MFNFITPLWLFVILILALIALGFSESICTEGIDATLTPVPSPPAETTPSTPPVVCPVDLSSQLSASLNETAGIKTELQTSKTGLEACNKSLATFTTNLDTCNKNLTTSSTSLTTCNMELEKVKKELESEKQKVADATSISKFTEEKQAMITAASTAEAKYTKDKSELQKKVDDLTAQVTDLTAKLSKCSSDRDKCYTERDESTRELKKCKSERQTAQEVLADCTKMRMSLNNDIENSQTGYKARIAYLTSENGNLTRQYNFDCAPRKSSPEINGFTNMGPILSFSRY